MPNPLSYLTALNQDFTFAYKQGARFMPFLNSAIQDHPSAVANSWPVDRFSAFSSQLAKRKTAFNNTPDDKEKTLKSCQSILGYNLVAGIDGDLSSISWNDMSFAYDLIAGKNYIIDNLPGISFYKVDLPSAENAKELPVKKPIIADMIVNYFQIEKTASPVLIGEKIVNGKKEGVYLPPGQGTWSTVEKGIKPVKETVELKPNNELPRNGFNIFNFEATAFNKQHPFVLSKGAFLEKFYKLSKNKSILECTKENIPAIKSLFQLVENPASKSSSSQTKSDVSEEYKSINNAYNAAALTAFFKAKNAKDVAGTLLEQNINYYLQEDFNKRKTVMDASFNKAPLGFQKLARGNGLKAITLKEWEEARTPYLTSDTGFMNEEAFSLFAADCGLSDSVKEKYARGITNLQYYKLFDEHAVFLVNPSLPEGGIYGIVFALPENSSKSFDSTKEISSDNIPGVFRGVKSSAALFKPNEDKEIQKTEVEKNN